MEQREGLHKATEEGGPPADEKAAKDMGHIPAVCRRSYIMPELLEGYVKSQGKKREEPSAKKADADAAPRGAKGEAAPRDGRFVEDPEEERFRQWVIGLQKKKAKK